MYTDHYVWCNYWSFIQSSFSLIYRRWGGRVKSTLLWWVVVSTSKPFLKLTILMPDIQKCIWPRDNPNQEYLKLENDMVEHETDMVKHVTRMYFSNLFHVCERFYQNVVGVQGHETQQGKIQKKWVCCATFSTLLRASKSWHLNVDIHSLVISSVWTSRSLCGKVKPPCLFKTLWKRLFVYRVLWRCLCRRLFG